MFKLVKDNLQFYDLTNCNTPSVGHCLKTMEKNYILSFHFRLFKTKNELMSLRLVVLD